MAQRRIRNGIEAFQQKRYSHALQLYQQAEDIDPKNPLIYYCRGNTLLVIELYEEAIKCYDHCIALSPHYAKVYNNKGLALRALNLQEEALECFEQSLVLDPKDPDPYNNKGNALQALNFIEEAIEAYNKSLELNPKSSGAHHNKGLALQALNMHEEALNCFNQSLIFVPSDAEAYYNKGNALFSLNRHQEAIESYDSCLELNSRHAKAFYNKGNALQAMGRYEESITCYDQCLQLTPNYAKAYCAKGNSLKALSLHAEALNCFNECIALNPQYTIAYCNKGKSLIQLNRDREALSCFNIAYELMKRTRTSMRSIGNISSIQRTLDEDREKLLLTLRDFEVTVITTSETLKRMNGRHTTVQRAIQTFNTLREERKDLVTAVVERVDEKNITIQSQAKRGTSVRLLVEQIESIQSQVKNLITVVSDHETRLNKTEKEIQRWNLTEEGKREVMRAMKKQLSFHEQKILLSESQLLRLSEGLNQSEENMKVFVCGLSELGLNQRMMERVVSVIRNEVSHQTQLITVSDQERNEWQRKLQITEFQTQEFTKSLEEIHLCLTERGQAIFLKELQVQVELNERKLVEVMKSVGVCEEKINALRLEMQESGLTRGELSELLPFIETLKVLMTNQTLVSPDRHPWRSQMFSGNPYKKSFFDCLRRELNAAYMASSCAQTEIVKNSLSGKLGKLGKLLTSVSGSIPMIGTGVQFLGLVLSSVDSIKQTQYVERYSRIASSVIEMDLISRGIASRLVEDSFDKSFLNQPESLFKRIWTCVLNLGMCCLESGVASAHIQSMITGVVMSEGSNMVAEKIVEKEKMFARAARFFLRKNKVHPDEVETETAAAAAAPRPSPNEEMTRIGEAEEI
jgi:tetratricopeptide (TPR) repeat protein